MPADEFLKVQRDIEDATVPRRAHPKGWEPGVDTAKGTLTVQAGDTPPQDWSAIIRELGLDPEAWTVDESQPVQVRTWDSGDKRAFYYRATVIPASGASTPDVDDLIREVKRRKPKPSEDILAERALVVCLADWQAGKSDHGGVEALVERLMALKDAVPKRVKEAQKTGRPISALYVVGMGDMVENCDGHYPQQTYGVELDRRQQVKLVRRLLTMMLSEWAKLPVKMVVGAVPGNHGENRKNGKSFTTFEDNDDLAVFEQVQEILGANPEAFGHISWVIPDGDMTLTLDVCGTVVAFAHGHQARGSGIPLAKLRTWWKGKMAAMHPVGDASVLVFAHYHHLNLLTDGPRSIFCCPSNDGGSRWFEEQGGPTTACGTLTFVADKDGWHDLRIL
ncbi:MAG TPA: hypothetical protein VIG24_18340 [Acidimicrobiia bacterium]